eukprot:1805322-Prymnesium_polylepis.1
MLQEARASGAPPPVGGALPTGVASVGGELLCSLRRASDGLLAPPDAVAAAAEPSRLVPTEHCQARELPGRRPAGC